MRALVPFVLLTAGCVSVPTHLSSYKDYKEAIAEAVDEGAPYGRSSLARCVASWSEPTLANRRSVSLRDLEASTHRNAKNWILLEIGSEGYERYDFVFVRDLQMSSSFGPPVDISLLPSGGLVRQLYHGDATELLGNAQVAADDASCYFLTISVDGTATSYALKGPLLDDRLLELIGTEDRALYRHIMKSQIGVLIQTLVNDAKGSDQNGTE